MDVERIERALREGPADEPIYRPGSHRRARGRWSLAVGAAVVTAVLLLGVATGVGLGLLREPAPGLGAGELEALAAALKGTWGAEEITREDWISQEVALGNNIDDVEGLLINNPMQSRIRYQLAFVGGRLTVSAAADGGPMVEQSGGPYRLLASGAIYYADLGCYVTVKFTITGGRLAFQRISTVSCGADERVANSAFFNLVPYARTGN